MTQPTPTGAVISANEIFLRAAFGPDWKRVKVCFIAGDPKNQPRSAWQGYPAEDMLKAAHGHFNTYFSVGVQTGTSRGLAGFEKICVIVLDDVGPKVDLAQAETLLGPPSYLLETSPGNFQAGWFTEIGSRDYALGLVTAIYQALGQKGDNLKNLVGYMRLPIGTNGKPHLGPKGFAHLAHRWSPQTRISGLDWIAIEKKLGGITPIKANATDPDRVMPDPLEIENDAVLQGFRLLGAVQGLGRWTTMGWGFDVECPWIADHSERAHEGTTYIPVKGRFHCHHGHCQNRTMGDVRERLTKLLRRDHGTTLAALEFEAVDPKTIPLPILPKDGAVDLWDEKVPPGWPGNILPPVIEDVLAEMAWRDGLDLGALGATMLTAASGAADKRTSLVPYAGSSWRVRPILWLMLVAETGQRKTAVLSLLNRLRQLNAQRMRQYARAMTAWKTSPGAKATTPSPTVAALLAEDVTIERLQEFMAHNPRGMLFLRDEIAALFDFGRYSGGPGAAERAFLLETNEGGPTTVARMTRTTQIDNCALAVLGATQPHRIAAFKGLADDGLLSRFATVVMGDSGDEVPGTPTGVGVIDSTIDRLLRNGAFDQYRTDAAGEALIRETRRSCAILAQRPSGVGLKGFLRKLHGVHARAALVLHLMDGGVDQIIPEDTVKRAENYVWFLWGHAEAFYHGLPDSADSVSRAVGSFLLRHSNITRITAGRLRSDVAPCRGLKTLREIQDAVYPLVAGRWLLPMNEYPGNSSWIVRPGLETEFAGRKATEAARVEAVIREMNRHGGVSCGGG
jgi:hypothetical protein